jgi:AAA15 family ATPase/GTPase
MIVSFSVTNFRSIRDSFEFSLEAESSGAKPDNLFEVNLVNEKKIRLLKSAVIYGPNASGKTNFIRAVYNLTSFIKRSSDLDVEHHIPYYEPFLLDPDTEKAPSKMSIDFLMPGENGILIRYSYEIEYNRDQVLMEELNYYPLGKSQNLFKRSAPAPNQSNVPATIHKAELGKNLGYKEYDVFRNQLLLSRFGKVTPHEQLTPVYSYFSNIEVWNALDIIRINRLKDQIADELSEPENAHLHKRLDKLLRISDTKINAITLKSTDLDQIDLKDYPKSRRKSIVNDLGRISAEHNIYKNGKIVGTRELSLREESAGTNVLFALGGIILKRLEKGGVLFFDELDNSLHPKLSKFLVRLFNNTVSNPNNSQLVVATHEVTLLDKDVFRKDQIWFSEKDKYGVTTLFSAKDFEGVRDETPFDRWYMNGKFGGQPNIKEIEFIFSNE